MDFDEVESDSSDPSDDQNFISSSLIKRISWKKEEDDLLKLLVEHNGEDSWQRISELMYCRTPHQCKQRWESFLDPELVKGPWTKVEDDQVIALVSRFGRRRWSYIATFLKGRTGKQCRERWHNHLDPDVNKSPWNDGEELLLYQLHRVYGNKWAKIAKFFTGRTDNSVKNHWHGTIRKRSTKPDFQTSFMIAEESQNRLNELINSGKKNSALIDPMESFNGFDEIIEDSSDYESTFSTTNTGVFKKKLHLTAVSCRIPSLGLENKNENERNSKKIIIIKTQKMKAKTYHLEFEKTSSNEMIFEHGCTAKNPNNLEVDPWWYRVACGMTGTQAELTHLARQFISSNRFSYFMNTQGSNNFSCQKCTASFCDHVKKNS